MMGVAVFQQNHLQKQVMGRICLIAIVCRIQESKGGHSETC